MVLVKRPLIELEEEKEINIVMENNKSVIRTKRKRFFMLMIIWTL